MIFPVVDHVLRSRTRNRHVYLVTCCTCHNIVKFLIRWLSVKLVRHLVISSICTSSPKAKVCGVVTHLSEINQGTSTSYWDGELSNKSGSQGIYDFDRGVRRKLWEYQEKGKPLLLKTVWLEGQDAQMS